MDNWFSLNNQSWIDDFPNLFFAIYSPKLIEEKGGVYRKAISPRRIVADPGVIWLGYANRFSRGARNTGRFQGTSTSVYFPCQQSGIGDLATAEV